jgi:nucleotide-binding universal stress UspA family protein
MYRNILIATDGSVLAQKAIDHGLGIAKGLGAKVTVVTVTEMMSTQNGMLMPRASDVDRYETEAHTAARDILDRAALASTAAGVPCDVVHVADKTPAEGVLETTATRGCDLIVMASHGRRGLDRLLLGSHAQEVMVRSAVPVLICR